MGRILAPQPFGPRLHCQCSCVRSQQQPACLHLITALYALQLFSQCDTLPCGFCQPLVVAMLSARKIQPCTGLQYNLQP